MEDKKRIEDSKFEDFLLQRNEKIDNLAYELLCELAGKRLEWNMYQIAEVWKLHIMFWKKQGFRIVTHTGGLMTSVKKSPALLIRLVSAKSA